MAQDNDDPIVVVNRKSKVNYSKNKKNKVPVPTSLICFFVVCGLIFLGLTLIKVYFNKESKKQQQMNVETNQYSNGEYSRKVGYYLYNDVVYYLYHYNDGDYSSDYAYSYSNTGKENNGWVELDAETTKTLIGYMLSNSGQIQFLTETYSEELVKYEIDQPIEYIAGYWYDRENNLIYGCHHREWYLYDADKKEYSKVDKDNSLVYKLEYYGFNYDELKKESGIDFVLKEGLDW